MKLRKIICEICGEDDPAALHYHHIVERTDPDSDNNMWNLAIICASCHCKHHEGNLEILGLYPSTKKPYGRVLVYKKDGVCNIPGLEKSCYTPKAQAMRIPNADKE
jgi:hypothetical protein